MEAGLRSTPRVGQRVQRASLFEVGLNNDHGILEPSGRQHTRVMSGRARPPKTLESRCTAGETLRYREIAIFELNDRNRNRGFRDTAALSFGRMKVGNSGSAEASMTPEPNLAATHRASKAGALLTTLDPAARYLTVIAARTDACWLVKEQSHDEHDLGLDDFIDRCRRQVCRPRHT
jgi:hypothetical protein